MRGRKKQTCVAEVPGVAAFAVAISVARVGDLAAAMFAGQTPTGVEQLPLLVAQGAAVTLVALAAVRLMVEWDTFSVDTPGKTHQFFF